MDISERLVLRYLQNECTEDEVLLLNRWLSEKDENKRELFLLETSLKSCRLKRYSDPEFLQTERIKLQKRIEKEAGENQKKI
jgi:hypothetical protein